jgi:hypothetical protein
MNRQLFKSWAENQLHEVDGKIVMIMDNGPYHCKLPTSNASKIKIARVGNKSEYYRANQEKWCRFHCFPARARGSEPNGVSILACRVTILACRIKLIHCPCGAPKEVVT